MMHLCCFAAHPVTVVLLMASKYWVIAGYAETKVVIKVIETHVGG
ncbi:MAG TPA: hypothetical protein PLZ21_03660 [Armatimonadota bacterium]|nr:hypothetical protein [Armatimonadota bacterium]